MFTYNYRHMYHMYIYMHSISIDTGTCIYICIDSHIIYIHIHIYTDTPFSLFGWHMSRPHRIAHHSSVEMRIVLAHEGAPKDISTEVRAEVGDWAGWEIIWGEEELLCLIPRNQRPSFLVQST